MLHFLLNNYYAENLNRPQREKHYDALRTVISVGSIKESLKKNSLQML